MSEKRKPNHLHLDEIKDRIGTYPDYPKKGIIFRDIFGVLQDPDTFTALRDILIETSRDIEPCAQCIVGLDARGFLLGPLVALGLKLPFVPVRKEGKLPGKVTGVEYEKEYGKDVLEIQTDSIKPGTRVLIVDDLLATGGSLLGAHQLVEKVGGQVVACVVVMELEDLKGRDKISSEVISLIKY